MAVLRSSMKDRLLVLPRMLVGRSPACDLRLEERHVSGEHATISWTGEHWEIRDLGSRNGTFVNGERLQAGQGVEITTDVQIAFGAPNPRWILVDDSPPALMAIHETTGEVRAGQDDLLILPDTEVAEVSVYADSVGWWMDDGNGPVAVDERSTIETSAGPWRLLLPSVLEGTPLVQHTLESVELHFAVSRNEERVEITVVNDGVKLSLTPREHAYVLLTLARARRADAELPPPQRGWRDRDELERMLALDANALNVAIHRARQQLSAAGVQGAAQIVEVRRNQRRLGTDKFRIGALKVG